MFDGYGGQGDILTKFGVRVTTEATFVISRERFEESVAPFLENKRMIMKYQIVRERVI